MASLMTAAPISSGLVFLKVPLGALPTAVRTAETITASLIIGPQKSNHELGMMNDELKKGRINQVESSLFK
jgi:hypothetical protein